MTISGNQRIIHESPLWPRGNFPRKQNICLIPTWQRGGDVNCQEGGGGGLRTFLSHNVRSLSYITHALLVARWRYSCFTQGPTTWSCMYVFLILLAFSGWAYGRNSAWGSPTPFTPLPSPHSCIYSSPSPPLLYLPPPPNLPPTASCRSNLVSLGKFGLGPDTTSEDTVGRVGSQRSEGSGCVTGVGEGLCKGYEDYSDGLCRGCGM